ncbi:unnamed protein product [Candidula unifasciata]|uniref:Transmembrane protein 192 n=1 Tax=Candidula unifasciata TaxID=100452 RepID=A0A8S3Z0K2_9EUPU|nr:unnamed protein product [Candidula unifasciata]
MVSLASNHNASQPRGFYGFSTDHVGINAAEPDDDDLIVDHIQLISGPETAHKPMNTTWAIVLAKILYIALGVSAYIIPLEYCKNSLPGGKCDKEAFSLTQYIHGGMWFVLFALDRYFHLKHEESRLHGYLEFYRKTRNIRRIPVVINSLANAVMVIVVQVLDNYCSEDDGCHKLSKANYVQILVSIECALALISLLIYLVHTVKFNYKKPLPDVAQEGHLSHFGAAGSDLGYRNEGHDDQVLEKQADMIRYLKQHTEVLAKRNLALTEEIYRLKSQRQSKMVR